MRNFKILAAALLLGSRVLAQSPLEDAKKQIDKENYVKARNILIADIAAGTGDRNLDAYYLGNAYVKMDEVDSAKMFYRMVGTAESKNKYAQLAYGRLMLLNGEIPTAKKYFESAAITSKMKDSEVLFQAGDALFRPTITDLNAAIGYLEDAYKLDNKNCINMLELGDAYLENNDGGKAMSKYESAADVCQRLTMAFIKIGRLDTRARTYDDAIIAYQKAIALEPDYAIAHKELGEAYYLAHKYDLAKPEFKKYIALNKDDADAKTKFLTFLYQIKEYEQCASEAQRMLGDDPTNFLILRAIFYSDLELKRFKDGLDMAQRFWVAAPTNKTKSSDYTYTARLAIQSGDTALSLKYFPMAWAADSGSVDLLRDYANLMYTTKRYYDAIVYFAKLTGNPKFTKVYGDYFSLGKSNYYIALTFKSRKDDPTARDSASFYFTAADTAFAELTSRPAYAAAPESWQWRAKTNNNLDPEMKTGSAKPFYEQFIKVAEGSKDPSKYKNFLVEAYQYLGAYYLNNKDKAAAKGYFEKALSLDPDNADTKELMKGL